MIKLLTLMLFVTCITALLAGCSKNNVTDEYTNWDTTPSITIDNNIYFAKDMPTPTLPDGYEFAGTIADGEYKGFNYYTNTETDDVYLYQECGVVINGTEVDTTQRQWAYVLWVINRD